MGSGLEQNPLHNTKNYYIIAYKGLYARVNMQNREKEILVYFDSNEFVFIGMLRSAIVRGKEVFSFNASNEYIKNEAFRFLDFAINKKNCCKVAGSCR